MASFSYGGGGSGGSFAPAQPPQPPLALPPAIRMAPGGGMEQAGATGGWQTLGQMNTPGTGAGIWNPPPLTKAPVPGQTPPGSWNLPQSPSQGGTTRRGSQILDAQGNVIGHYDDNNQPVYHGGQGGGAQGQTPSSWDLPGQRGPIWTGQGPVASYPEQGRDIYHGGNMRPPGGFPFPQNIASTSMGMAPSSAKLGVPGSMQQSLYGNGLLRPAMPSMNNQSGY